MAQLRDVNNELDAVARPDGSREADAVDFTLMLREAVDAAGQDADGIVVHLMQDAIVAGPAGDLRELMCCLLDFALAVGRGRAALHTRIKEAGSQAGPVCTAELTIFSSDVPDFLRRRLWDAVRARRGEVSIISEPDCSRVEFTLPIKRCTSPAAVVSFPDAA